MHFTTNQTKAILAGVALSGAAGLAQADVTPVSAPFVISSASFLTSMSTVVRNASGNFVVGWLEGTYSGAPMTLLVQPFSSSGQPLSAPITLTTDLYFNIVDNQEKYFWLAMNDSGEFDVAWLAKNNAANGTVEVQRFSATGQAQGVPVKALESGMPVGEFGMDAAGDFLLVWIKAFEVNYNASLPLLSPGWVLHSNNSFIKARVYNANGRPKTGLITVFEGPVNQWCGISLTYVGVPGPKPAFCNNLPASGSEVSTFPAAAISSSGNFMVEYASTANPYFSATTADLVVQAYTADGALSGQSESPGSSNSVFYGQLSAFPANGNGFVLTTPPDYVSGQYQTSAIPVSSTGAIGNAVTVQPALQNPNAVVSSSGPVRQMWLTPAQNGDLLATWIEMWTPDNYVTLNYSAYGQFYDPTGNVKTAPFQIGATVDYAIEMAPGSLDANEELVTVGGGDFGTLYGQLFSAP